MIDVFDDAVGTGGPDERLGFALVFAGLPVDRGLRVDQRWKGAALQASTGKRGEEGLDRIRPWPRNRDGRRCRGDTCDSS